MSSHLETIINLIIPYSWFFNVCPLVTEFNGPLEWQGSPGPHSIVGTFSLWAQTSLASYADNVVENDDTIWLGLWFMHW